MQYGRRRYSPNSGGPEQSVFYVAPQVSNSCSAGAFRELGDPHNMNPKYTEQAKRKEWGHFEVKW